MGFVRRITGVQGQIDAAKQNAAAQEAATKEASEAQARSMRDSAQAAADQQAQMAARQAVEMKSAEVLAAPLDNAEVLLSEKPGPVGTAAGRKRKATFGTGGYSTGVSI